jgi:hypothetical protein
LDVELWVSGGSGTKKHKGDTLVYLGSGYRGPTSSSEVSFKFRSTQIGGGGYIRGEREFGRGSFGAILWLVGGEVSSTMSEESALSLARLSG